MEIESQIAEPEPATDTTVVVEPVTVIRTHPMSPSFRSVARTVLVVLLFLALATVVSSCLSRGLGRK